MAETLDTYRKAFLLLQLLGAKEGRMSKSEANALVTKGPNRRALDLPKAGEVNRLRASLCPEYIATSKGRTAKGGTAEFYELTPRGLEFLLSQPQYPDLLTVSGLAITRLLDAMRTSGSASREQVSSASQPTESALIEIAGQVLRERYPGRHLVPIHALRDAVLRRYGRDAARHDVLDATLMQLWREGKVRLVPISNPRDASAEELQNSIPDEQGALFYLELRS